MEYCNEHSQTWIQMGTDSDPRIAHATAHRSFELHTQDGKLLKLQRRKQILKENCVAHI